MARASRGRGRPGTPPPVSVTTRRSARPMVRFARQPGPSTPIPLLRPSAVARRAVDDHELAGGLRGHRLAVEVEGGVERRLDGGEHDREVRRGGSPRAPRRRRRARASPRPSRAAPRRASALRRARRASRRRARGVGGTTGQPVGPAAREHLLELVGAAPAACALASRRRACSWPRSRACAGGSLVADAGAPARRPRPSSSSSASASQPVTPRTTSPRAVDEHRSSAGSRGRRRRRRRTAPARPARCPVKPRARATRAATLGRVLEHRRPGRRPARAAARRAAPAGAGRARTSGTPRRRRPAATGPPARSSLEPDRPAGGARELELGGRLRGAGAATDLTPYRRRAMRGDVSRRPSNRPEEVPGHAG